METRYSCALQVIGEIKKNFALVIGKNKKNLDLFTLEGSKI